MTRQPASNLVVGAHGTITHLLSQPSWDQWDAAVVMLSRLMAADAYVLAPTVARHLPEGQNLLQDLAGRRLDLERSLLALYSRVHGDARVAGLPLDAVQRRALTATEDYLAVRDDLAVLLFDHLDDSTAGSVASRWLAALTNAATRPHPWLASRRTQGAIGFHWARLWDRMRDTLDSRPTGSPAAA
jgi:hypothetical protein